MCLPRKPSVVLAAVVMLACIPMALGASGIFDPSVASDAALIPAAPQAQTYSNQQWRHPARAVMPVRVEPVAPLTYTVKPSDCCLSTIAARLYGSSSDWPALWWANRSKIKDPNVIGTGLVLVLGNPRAPTAAMTKAALAAIGAMAPAPAAPSQGSSPAPPASVQPSGTYQDYAAGLLGSYGWDGGQMGCLVPLWNQESGWNPLAANASGAYGIPQALPGSKMASAGSDWLTNGDTQIRWGLGYIKSDYGTPCNAWGHEQSYGWY